ncbi:Six-hairpin glycosidase-like protein [Mycena venus]|uniref:Six-hairpin glycosidase-like protein n=1 Tax=Mycena venus TaxID=2733690 RepID=A0A8H6XRQ6_9AGAR|nr:Six-hairpin glycosidase-like protein [Mycena venus]
MDRLSSGNGLIDLYKGTGNDTYRTAFTGLRNSINLNSRNVEDGLWYFVYPNWSYLDGMYSLVPFYAYYTILFDARNASAIADMMRQLDLLWTHCAAANGTGLLVHGYDDSKTAVWADPVTGASPHVWGRSLGRTRASGRCCTARFCQLAGALPPGCGRDDRRVVQLLDQPGRAGNYIESSGSAMFAYALLKGVRLGYLENGVPAYTDVATRAYKYITDTFVVHNSTDGTLGYNGTVSVCSLEFDCVLRVLCWATNKLQQCPGIRRFRPCVLGVREPSCRREITLKTPARLGRTFVDLFDGERCLQELVPSLSSVKTVYCVEISFHPVDVVYSNKTDSK